MSVVDPASSRQVAHVLTVLGFDEDGPLYHLECRASARDYAKFCTVYDACHCTIELADEPCRHSPTGEHVLLSGRLCRPEPGCWMADYDDLDEAVRRLDPRRGIHLVRYTLDDYGAASLEILAQILSIGLAFNAQSAVAVQPTTATRYPGFGPEADLRELIEAALCEGDSLEWNDDTHAMIIDASAAAEAVLAWAIWNSNRPVVRYRTHPPARSISTPPLTAGDVL